MAEFASAIIGLVQVTENVALQIYRYVKRVKKADQEVRQLSAIVTSLLGIVHGIELAVRELDSHSKDHVLQSEDLVACKNTISQLNLKLSAFVDPIQPGESSLKIHKKWKWPFSISETKELNLKLEAHKSALSLSLATDNLCAILRLSEAQEVVRSDLQVIQTRLEAQTRIALTKKRESALQRLCALTPLHHHKTNRKLRQPGTGDWFIESSEFQTWLATGNAKLWVYGIPGAGKSILMAYAIEKILSLEDAQSTDSAVAYFYCDYKDSKTQTPQAILSSLAQQIARQDERSFAKLETFVKTHSADKQSATLSYENEELCELIVDMATNFEKVALVVDGLDECEGFVACVTSYLADLARRSQQIKMLLSSRSLIEISEQVEDYQRISIAARNSDLVLFVGEQIGERMKPKSLHPLRIKDPALKGEILDTMVRKADGMFRWAALQLDYICGLPTDKSIRDALKSLPPDLFSSYERLIVQLGKKPQSVRDLVQRALRWVLSADLYQSAKAICEAVSIEPDMHRYDATAVPDKLEILRHCGSFIRESFDGHHLESAHFTVKEFFSAIDIAKKPELTPYRLDDRDARRYFAETTLTYLCLDDFEDNHSCTTLQRVREDGMSFRQIAVEKWFFWSRDFLGDRAIMRLVKKLFSQNDRRNLRMWGVNFFTYWRSLALQPEPLMNLVAQTVDCLSPLHYAAMLDMPELCQWLIEQGCSTTSLSPIGSPLHCAILGPMSTVFWTQETECSSLNAEAFREILSRFYGVVGEPFLYRNLHNLKQSLQILVSSGANVNEGRAFAGQTDTPPNLLDLAAYTADLICHGDHSEEWLDVTASLVDAGATFKETDSLGVLLSVLDRGLKDGRKYPSIGDLLRKLTKHNLKNHECESLETFLRRWREREPHAYFADQSTQPVGITLTGTDDSSILWFEAAKYDYVDVVARFLSSEAQDVNILNEDGFSALHLAAMRSSIEVVRRLVEHGADINKASNTGSTPLLEALATADKNLIGYLLANSADYTSKDYEDRNIWHFASENESIDALLELSSLPQSVRGLVDLKDSSGQTPLSNAARIGHPEAFFLLLDFQVDEWVTDNRGRTLLHFAAMGGSIKLIEFLINHGHSVLGQDKDGYNALLHAASGTDQDLSRMQCLRALYEANSTCALAKTNDGFSVEDLILDNVIFSLEDENALDNWNEVQAIFMRDSRPSIEKLVLRIQDMHEVSASEEELGKQWSNLTRIFEPLLQDYFDDISALLGSVLTTLLTIYVSTYKVFVDVESLVDLLCSVIDAMTSTQMETLRVNKRRVLNLVLSSGEPRLISCLVGKNLNVDALGFAIDRHDLEQCKQLVMDGASLSEQCSRETQLTPFLHALYNEDLPIASYFLEKGSSCNGITPDHLPTHSYTALHYCTVLGDKDLLNAILDSCPALIFVATDIHPVHLAIILRQNEILRIMLDRSLDCWQKASSSGMLALCANGNADVGRQPVDSRRLPTKTRKMGILENPSLTEVRVQLRSTTWLASGPDGNLQKYQGFSPMHCAVKASNVEALRLLSSYGALVDSLSSELKTTPLGEAVYIRQDEIVSYLLDDGASMHGYNEECTSIVEEIAIRAENALFERVSPSISHAWHMDITDRNMVSRFATATYPDALIRLGADAESLTTPDMYGQSALIHCFEYGSASVFSYILNSGLDLSGSTPTFGSAVNYSWRDVDRYVLQRLLRRLGRQTGTALLNKKPQYRHTPLYDAAATDQCRILELLLAYEVDLDMVGGPLGSALMAAATYGRLEAVEVLVDAGAAISYFSVEDATTKSAFVQAMHFPRIQRWLLVNRFLRKKWLAWQ